MRICLYTHYPCRAYRGYLFCISTGLVLIKECVTVPKQEDDEPSDDGCPPVLNKKKTTIYLMLDEVRQRFLKVLFIYMSFLKLKSMFIF